MNILTIKEEDIAKMLFDLKLETMNCYTENNTMKEMLQITSELARDRDFAFVDCAFFFKIINDIPQIFNIKVIEYLNENKFNKEIQSLYNEYISEDNDDTININIEGTEENIINIMADLMHLHFREVYNIKNN